MICSLANDGQFPIIQNNDAFSPNGTSYSSDCTGFTQSTGNLSVDPGFVNRKGGNYQLLSTSPLIDAGLNSAPMYYSTDFAGNPRVVDGNGDGVAVIDIRFVADALGVRSVSPDLAEELVRSASRELRPEFPRLVPSSLDNKIWKYQRAKEDAGAAKCRP
jgi:hypothetical protein